MIMARKGENKKSKALSAPTSVHISRKENVWTVRTKAGPHTKDTSVALGLVVRNYAHIAETLKEAKAILALGKVKVNGIVRADHQLAIGLFDVIEIPEMKKQYRVILDVNGRLVLKESAKALTAKLARVEHKAMTPQGVQVTTNDGRTYLGVKAQVGDTLKLKLPANTVEKVLSLKEGARIYILRGAHIAETAKVTGIVAGTQKKEALVKFEKAGKEYETIVANAFVIGEKDMELDDLKE